MYFSFHHKNNFWLYLQYGPKVVNKFTKLGKIGFCMECFTAVFFRIFNGNVKIWLMGVQLGTRHQIEAFQGFSGNFLRS